MSYQNTIMESVRDHPRTVVAACHAPGKTHIAARIAAWWISVWPPGTALVVTTARTFRQVKTQLWPHLRRLVERHQLPGWSGDPGGRVNLTEWWTGGEMVAYGFSPDDETAAQGIHAPHLLVIVDEAAGISEALGGGFDSLMSTAGARILVIGNPPTDDMDTWFERKWKSPSYNSIKISVYDTPNFTGEETGLCGSCPRGVDPHPVSDHLVTRDWVEEVRHDHGEESAYWVARVLAEFPDVVANRIVPVSWIEAAAEEPDQVTTRGRNQLGVDVASGGGDEFVVAWALGNRVSVPHTSSGAANADPVEVARVVLDYIKAAVPYGHVTVNIDVIGVGWGVVGLLERWVSEQMIDATVVGVNVGERANDPDEYINQRAEMWWNLREEVHGRKEGENDLWLDVDTKTQAQLSGPKYRTTSGGKTQLESKDEMRRRGLPSPDRGDAIALARYEANQRGAVLIV